MEAATIINLHEEWKPGEGPRNAKECAEILLEVTQRTKMLRISQTKCQEWMSETGGRVEHPTEKKHMRHSVTSRESKCSLTLAEVAQLLLDCGASMKVIKSAQDKLRADGVGKPIESSRWVWVKNEGSQSKSK